MVETRYDYRADIDGLRAIAVFAVIAYHAAFMGFTGGFVGVDIFFVISGYLITRHLVDEIRTTGSLKFARFYSRRMLRLLPALLLTVVACLLVWTWKFVGVPTETATFLSSVRAALAAAANIFFRDNTEGYFDTNSDSMPLLHFWSLGVEEQFYLVWPLVLLLCFGFYRRYLRYAQDSRRFQFVVLSFFLIVSFAGNVITLARGDHKRAFYDMEWRMWEFAIGGFVDYCTAPFLMALRKMSVGVRRWLLEGTALLGLALLIICINRYDSQQNFPGFLALVPALATAMVILAGTEEQNFVTKVLSWRPLVFVGLISYGWYLWHWPLLVFGRLWLGGETPPISSRIILVIVSAVIAWLSRSFFENPIRYSQTLRCLQPRAILVGGLSCLLLIALSTWGLERYDAYVAKTRWPGIIAMTEAREDASKDCNVNFENLGGPLCTRPIGFHFNSNSATLAMWGNSHADALFPLVEKYIEGKNIRGILYFAGGPPGLIYGDNFFYRHEKDTERFSHYHREVLADIIRKVKEHPEQKFSVLLADRWMAFAVTKTLSADDRILFIEKSHEHEATMKLLESALQRTLQELTAAGVHKILLMLPYPEFKYGAARCYVQAPGNCDTSRAEMEKYRAEVNAILIRVAAPFSNVKIFDPMSALCTTENCPEFIDDHGKVIPVVFDASHPSVRAAEFLVGPERGDLDWLVN